MDKTGIKPQTFDESTLRAKVVEAINANPKAVADYKAGKTAAANKIKGEVMKANQRRPQRSGPAPSGRRTGEATRLATERRDALLVHPEERGIDGVEGR